MPVWAGSFAISATHAVPDASILTMTEFFGCCIYIWKMHVEYQLLQIVILGMEVQVMLAHMVKKYENAGISSICIEDKTFPKQNSLLERRTIMIFYLKKNLLQKFLAAK